ncbi:hypothetical protein COCSUDRAFT_38557 [Coccomyxa subellipsoidea C-169]|uniref:Uncharacterized protein n=1 Tax=Coccomyxa subellipsoidea (strain C-169) TaxID=574566 RepID=I0YK60_COCSC|nr:hypothetical protein COCSUDRAFT_38557 [Coccomyxa subellipsoidea C-169]EIE18779.1 hypothetical protein COCSUDRAFT_38557 [Coccomyxa subellipsoidea C-169]|eukprot:XP_005643323.1 hypothetical protein COCSUDRAFT_38557 [Coccomyxa subellipsoidea C-169]
MADAVKLGVCPGRCWTAHFSAPAADQQIKGELPGLPPTRYFLHSHMISLRCMLFLPVVLRTHRRYWANISRRQTPAMLKSCDSGLKCLLAGKRRMVR